MKEYIKNTLIEKFKDYAEKEICEFETGIKNIIVTDNDIVSEQTLIELSDSENEKIKFIINLDTDIIKMAVLSENMWSEFNRKEMENALQKIKMIEEIYTITKAKIKEDIKKKTKKLKEILAKNDVSVTTGKDSIIAERNEYAIRIEIKTIITAKNFSYEVENLKAGTTGQEDLKQITSLLRDVKKALLLINIQENIDKNN
jgi:hypothetical protein